MVEGGLKGSQQPLQTQTALNLSSHDTLHDQNYLRNPNNLRVIESRNSKTMASGLSKSAQKPRNLQPNDFKIPQMIQNNDSVDNMTLKLISSASVQIQNKIDFQQNNLLQRTFQGLKNYESSDQLTDRQHTTTTENRPSSSLNEHSQQDIKKKKKRTGPKLILNLHYTQYPIVKTIALELGFRCRTDDINILALAGIDAQAGSPPVEDFDVCWIDCGVPAESLAKLKPYQRINQFPGIQVISNKSKLARNLMKMRKCYPQEYDFFPQTFLLPLELNDFRNHMRNRREIFIVKPEALCQGKGIYLVKDPMEVSPDEHLVAQRYLADPFLLDGLKFDLRIYVLLAGVRPLRIFIYKEGLVRLATEPYSQPTDYNMKNHFMHLTNYAINKNSEKFIENDDDEGQQDDAHKRPLSSFYQRLEDEGYYVEGLKQEINDIVIKTIIVGQPTLAHIYKTCQAEDIENQSCFQILGFDIMIDSQLKPWLLEVNQSPSFKTDANLDNRIKGSLIRDTLRLLNLSYQRKMRQIANQRNQLKQRMLTGKKIHLSPEEREIQIQKKQDIRNRFEQQNLGDYELIFPPQSSALQQEYKILQDQACLNWEELTTGRRRAPPTKFTVSNSKDDPRGTIHGGNIRKLSIGGNELKQNIAKQNKKVDHPIQFRNTFANEIRSLAQSQLVKQLETKGHTQNLSQFKLVCQEPEPLNSIPMILGGSDFYQASQMSTSQKQDSINKTMGSSSLKPPKLPPSKMVKQETPLIRVLNETATPSVTKHSMLYFQIEPPIQPQTTAFHQVSSPKRYYQKLVNPPTRNQLANTFQLDRFHQFELIAKPKTEQSQLPTINQDKTKLTQFQIGSGQNSLKKRL